MPAKKTKQQQPASLPTNVVASAVGRGPYFVCVNSKGDKRRRTSVQNNKSSPTALFRLAVATLPAAH